MPAKNMTVYMREYNKRRYLQRRELIINELGGICAKCGCTDHDKLQFDHIDKESKSFDITFVCWWMSWKRLLPEIRKCQILCSDCHVDKTTKERGQLAARLTHGTISSYRYCKCELCKKAHREYHIKWKKRHLSSVGRASAL